MRPTEAILVGLEKTSFNQYGLVLSMSKGKTELMFMVAGGEHKQILHTFRHEVQGSFQVVRSMATKSPSRPCINTLEAQSAMMLMCSLRSIKGPETVKKLIDRSSPPLSILFLPPITKCCLRMP